MTNEVRELFEFVASGGRSVLYDYGSRAASVQDDVRVTEMINGVLVSRPAKKEKEPEITILNDSWERRHGKAASSTSTWTKRTRPVNGVRELFNLHFG